MRDQTTNLKSLILGRPNRFEFVQATRWLRLLCSSTSLDLRFRAAATKSFPDGEIENIDVEGNKLQLFVNFLGLVGPCGVLPHTDKDLVSGAQADRGLKGFLDVFDNRLISLFYEVWCKNRHEIALEAYRRGVREGEDTSTLVLMSLCGRGIPAIRDQCEFSDDVFPALAGLLSRNVRTSDAIAKCVFTQFRLPVKINEFIKERKTLPEEIRTRIGSERGKYNQLGSTAYVGQYTDAHKERFEVEIGPLSKSEFHSYCPYGTNERFRKLVDLVLVTLGRTLDVDVRFHVHQEAVESTVLGKNRLGYDSWVLSEPSSRSRKDPVKRFCWNYSRTEGES